MHQNESDQEITVYLKSYLFFLSREKNENKAAFPKNQKKKLT